MTIIFNASTRVEQKRLGRVNNGHTIIEIGAKIKLFVQNYFNLVSLCYTIERNRGVPCH